MTPEILKSEIAAMANDISDKLKKIEDGRQADDAQYKSVWTDLKKATTEATELAKKAAERIDQLEKVGATKAENLTFGQRIEKALRDEKDKLAGYAQSRERFTVRKAVGDLSTSANLTGAIAEQERLPGIAASNYRTHARSILPFAASSLPITEFVRHTGGEGGPNYQLGEGPAFLTEGQLKKQTDQDFALVTVNNYTIAHWERMPTQWLADYATIVAYIQNNMIEQLLNFEDDALLNGSGVNAISGLFTQASAFAPGVTVTAPQRFDVLRLAIAQLAVTGINGGGYNPDFILLNPMDFASMQLTKDQDENYILPAFLSESGGTVSGVRVIPHRAVTLGEFLVGESRQCLVQVYQPITLDISNEDRDNFIRNLVTVRVEERIKFPVLRPDAFVTETFENAITAITPAP